MNDPFDVLREQLVRASLVPRRRRRVAPALIAAALVLGGGATAAAVTLSGQPAAKRAPRYQVALTPDLTTGAAGWCVNVRRDSAPAGHGCGSARAPGTHLIAAGGLVGEHGVLYAVVGPEVARVRLGDRRVTPRRDPALPPEWRLAVATVDTPVPGVAPRPNAVPGATPPPNAAPGATPRPPAAPGVIPPPNPAPGATPPPNAAPGATPRPPAAPGATPPPNAAPGATPRPPAAPGVIPSPNAAPGATPPPNAPGGRVYERPPAEGPVITLYDARGRRLPSDVVAGPDRLPSRVVDADAPPRTRCALRAAAGSRLRGASARIVTTIPSAPLDVIAPSFLTCATTVFYRGKTRFRVAFVLGAHDTDAVAPLLPGIEREPDGPVALGQLVSARREGRGWLLVYSGARARERAEVLEAVSVQEP